MTTQHLVELSKKGRAVFERVPEPTRPIWALSFLKLVDTKISNRPKPVRDLYEIVENQQRWSEAYNQFQKIREFSISNADFKPEEYLILAERISKVTYNQTEPKAPFDQDSGWAIPYLALEISANWKDKNLEMQVKKLIQERK